LALSISTPESEYVKESLMVVYLLIFTL
jgi:hypothetical protein